MSIEEFEEIAHTGGKITFVHHPGQGTAVKIEHCNPWAASLHQVCISFEGEILDFVPFGGIGRVIPYPQPSILAFLISDKEGLFGRQCPECNSYFRSNFLTSKTTCAYCGHQNRGVEFLTKNQLQFIQQFCYSFIEADTTQQTIEVNLDDLINGLDENQPGWVYTEERQQSKHTCSNCRCIYDILGDYGVCPCCSRPNFRSIVVRKFDEFEQQFIDVDTNITDRHEREIEWEKLTRCVSEFETLANTVRMQLLKIPLIPHRRAALSRVGFQRIINSSEQIENWFGIKILEGLTDDDRSFLNKMFNRRHVFTHNGGRVDQEYLDNTGDVSVRINQVIRLHSREIRRLIPMVRQCAINFVGGLESLVHPMTSGNDEERKDLI